MNLKTSDYLGTCWLNVNRLREVDPVTFYRLSIQLNNMEAGHRPMTADTLVAVEDQAIAAYNQAKGARI